MKIGIVDIGSNSIRTMTAEAADGRISYSEKQVYTTRLAEGLAASRLLSGVRMEQSIAVIRQFSEEMRLQSTPVYAYATSAVRDAGNRDAFVKSVSALGVPVDVLTGEEEAHFAFLAATGGKGGLMDIGGGSTQLVREGNAVSVPLGCVRAKDLAENAVSLVDIRQSLLPTFERLFPLQAFSGVPAWSGVGGTITTLAAYAQNCRAYDKRAVAGAQISRETLESALTRIDNVPLAERAQIPLLARRYDVILHGGAILLYIMKNLAIEQLRVSDADGMEGYAMRILAEKPTAQA